MDDEGNMFMVSKKFELLWKDFQFSKFKTFQDENILGQTMKFDIKPSSFSQILFLKFQNVEV